MWFSGNQWANTNNGPLHTPRSGGLTGRASGKKGPVSTMLELFHVFFAMLTQPRVSSVSVNLVSEGFLVLFLAEWLSCRRFSSVNHVTKLF